MGRTADEAALLSTEHRAAIHLHCYRMLGSFHDAEEATQETLLRAWRALPSFEGRAPLRHWLYRIATTTCLNVIAARARRPGLAPAEITWLQPYPDELIDQLPAGDPDPAALAERRESVRLAFIAALQALPATQRAVLILRDVLAWSAAEVAGLLETSVAAVNSALQRARAGMPAPAREGTLSDRDREVAHRFMAAWNRCDIDALAALLREDALLRMPPEAVEILGRAAMVDFFATVPAGGQLDQFTTELLRANGSWAVATYLPDEAGLVSAYGMMILTCESGLITAITGFPEPSLFPHFGLGLVQDGRPASTLG